MHLAGWNDWVRAWSRSFPGIGRRHNRGEHLRNPQLIYLMGPMGGRSVSSFSSSLAIRLFSRVPRERAGGRSDVRNGADSARRPHSIHHRKEYRPISPKLLLHSVVFAKPGPMSIKISPSRRVLERNIRRTEQRFRPTPEDLEAIIYKYISCVAVIAAERPNRKGQAAIRRKRAPPIFRVADLADRPGQRRYCFRKGELPSRSSGCAKSLGQLRLC